MEQDNRATIARLGEVEVATLPTLPRADPALLAAGRRRAAARPLAHRPMTAAPRALSDLRAAVIPVQRSPLAATSTIEASISHSTGARSSV